MPTESVRTGRAGRSFTPVRRLRWIALIWLLTTAATALAAPRIGLVTMEPGQTYWERFGHNAILVDAGDGSQPLLYNYGMFDFDEPGFMAKFLRGRMRYRLVEQTYSESLSYYAAVGRGVGLQWLDLTPDQAQALAGFLAWNARPENAHYRYDYFLDNCSTRVRDALDLALDGQLKPQLVGRARGLSYRFEALRLGAEPLWMGLGMSLGLGPFAERQLSRWDEAFVPMRLRDGLREVRTAAGTPLVIGEQALLVHRLSETAVEAPSWWPRFLAVGLLLAGLIRWLAPRRPRLFSALAGGFWLLSGLTGLGLAALWLLTAHIAAWGNENLLLFNPLCLLLLPLAWRSWRSGPKPRLAHIWLVAVTLLAGMAVFLKFLPFRVQDNIDWIALMLPIHLALYFALRRKPAPTDRKTGVPS